MSQGSTERILIIQLARMGDILQTTPALIGLRNKYPNAKIDIVVRETFKNIIANNPYINEVYSLDTKDIMSNLILRKGSLIEVTSKLKNFTKELEDNEYDIVYNLSFSVASTYLTYIVGKNKVYGLTRSEDGYYTASDDWSKYFVATVMKDTINHRHLVDLFKSICEVTDNDDQLYIHKNTANRQWAKNELTNCGYKSSDKLIAIQTGASTSDKKWPINNYISTINALLESSEDIKIMLTGSKSELSLSEKLKEAFQNQSDRVFNFIGQTNLSELSSLLSYCDLLITNDTGPLHIATALSIKVLCLSMGSSNIIQTGPYGKATNYTITPSINCYPCNLTKKCGDLKCKSSIKSTTITKMALDIINNKEIKNEGIYQDEEIVIYKGEIKKSLTEDNIEYSFVEYTPLSDRVPTTKEIMYDIYKTLWNYMLDAFDEQNIAFNTFPNLDTVAELHKVLELLNHLFQLSEIGIKYTKGLIAELNNKDLAIESINKLSNQIAIVDENITTIGKVSTYVSPIVNMFNVEKECLVSTDIKELSEQTSEIYNKLRGQTQYVFQMISQIIQATEENISNRTTETSKEAYTDVRK
jgi:ADP-heptose:LPS heptosyltransferase